MNAFRAGQRVRIRVDAKPQAEHPNAQSAPGREGWITQHFAQDWWVVKVDGIDVPIGCAESALEPIIDPKAETFLATIKRLEREPVTIIARASA